MTSGQKAIKYIAVAIAIFLIINIGIGIVSLIGSGVFVFSLKESKGEIIEYPIEGDIYSLDIDINAAVIEIQTGEDFSLRSNCEKLSVKEKDNCLIIEEKSKKNILRRRDYELTLTIPDDYVFDNIDLSAGAGEVHLYELAAETMNMEFGAGEVDIVGLTATSSVRIDGGVGEVSIDRCSLNNARINMGVGEFDIKGRILGRSEIDYGVGEADLNLEGSSDDYTIEMDKGLGESKIEGEPIKSNTIYGRGKNYIVIDGGIGEIDVNFY